jgi:hypothetical protein
MLLKYNVYFILNGEKFSGSNSYQIIEEKKNSVL